MQSNNNILEHPPLHELFDKLYYKSQINTIPSLSAAVVGPSVHTHLSNLFFSDENVDIIQNGIRRGVFDKSNEQYMIGKQDDSTIRIIMNSVFLSNSQNVPNNNISSQITSLNKIVLHYCINELYDEIKWYKKYLSDIDELPLPIKPPTLIVTKRSEKSSQEFMPWL